MIYGPVNGEMTELTYDCRNRLISAGNVTYTYDAEDNRISKETPTYLEQYVTDTVSGEYPRVLETYVSYKDSDSHLTTEYIYGFGLISESTVDEAGNDSNTLYHHYNNLGNTIKLTDKNGVVVESYSYGTYGELLSGSADLTEFLYNGRSGVITDENGLYYMRARYYNPEIKRFINQDVVRGSIANSQSLNRYSYVQGNPVSYTDPFGLSPIDGLFTNTNFIHGVLGLLGCIPGVIGIVANVADAIIYAVVDKDYGMAALSIVNAATLGLAARASALAKAAKTAEIVAKIKKYSTMQHALKLISNTANIIRAGVDIYHSSVSLIDNYYANGGQLGKGAAGDILSIGLNLATCIKSGIGIAEDGPALIRAINKSESNYIPRDSEGNPIPLKKQRINGQDIPLPDPVAEGRPHTVLGGKVSSETGEVYRQSATFPGGTWPSANGYDVPWSEVHWTDHGTSQFHTNPHEHIFEYNPDKGGWIRKGPSDF